jgi:hypothetical protein
MSKNGARTTGGKGMVGPGGRMTKGMHGWGLRNGGLLDAMRIRTARIVTGTEQEPMDRLTNRQASTITGDERTRRNRRRAMQTASRRRNRGK